MWISWQMCSKQRQIQTSLLISAQSDKSFAVLWFFPSEEVVISIDQDIKLWSIMLTLVLTGIKDN